MAKSTTIAKGRSAERREARRAEAINAAAISTNSGASVVARRRWFDGDDGSGPSRWHLPRRRMLEGSIGAGLESQILLHHRLFFFFIYIYTGNDVLRTCMAQYGMYLDLVPRLWAVVGD